MMMRRFPLLVPVALCAALLAALVGSASATTIHGSAYDTLNATTLNLGSIKYVFNDSGYQFWFTTVGPVGSYTVGDSYHNVYKYSVGDPTDWCTATIPDRAPYNIGGHVGNTVYYKSWDVTTNTSHCGVFTGT